MVAIIRKEQVSAHVKELLANPAALEGLLVQCGMNDTDKIKAAEEILKQYTKKPACVSALATQMRSSGQVQARQLAAVLLSKKLPLHWAKFSPDQQREMKAALLACLAQEPQKLVRHAIATVIARISKELFKDPAGWPEVLAFIANCAGQTTEDFRELAFVLLHELTETVGDALKAHFGDLKNLFLQALADPSPKVQIAALESCSALMAYLSLEKEALIFRDLILPTLAVAQQCVQRNDDSSIAHVLDVFNDLVMSPLQIITPYMNQTVEFLMNVLRNVHLEMSTRDAASLVLGSVAECKPKQLGKTGLMPAIIQTLVEMIASYEGSAAYSLFQFEGLTDENNNEDEDDDDGRNTQSIAQTLLDQLALAMPVKYIFPPSMEVYAQCYAHPNFHMRKAAVALIGVITEGCVEQVQDNLAELLPRVLGAARDPETLVRECACFTLGQFSEHCQPDILDYHAEILPVVFQLLDDATDSIKGVSCYVLEMFCENLQPETVKPFLEPLMIRLVQMLGSPKRTVQEMSVAAIASTAIAAERSFQPYAAPVVDRLAQMLNITEEPYLQLRGRALECMGHIAIAIEADAFEPYIMMCMHSCSNGLKIEDLQLHEFIYTFFANLAKVLTNRMAPYIPELVPHLIAEIKEKDGEDVAETAKRLKEEDGSEASEDGDYDSDDSDDDSDMYVNVRTAELDKKKAALIALGALAEFYPLGLAEHLNTVLECLTAMIDYWHTEIREEVCTVLKATVGISVAMYPPEMQWQAGQAIPLHQHTAELTSAVITLLMTRIKTDMYVDVVAKACESIQGIVLMVGPMAVTPHLNDMMQMLLMLLTDKTPAQQRETEEDDLIDSAEHETGEGEDEEDGDRSRYELNEAVLDMMAAFARVIGPNFHMFFDNFLPVVLDKLKGTSPAVDRQLAMGSLAEILEALGPQTIKYFQVLLPVMKKALADGDIRVKRNTCFCVGVLAQGAGQAALEPVAIGLLQAIEPIFHLQGKGTSEGGLVDNAASAVARIIMTAPSAVPIEQVLPVLLASLPLKVDMDENETVYGCLVGLLTMRHPAALAALPNILSILAKVLSDESTVQDTVKEKVKVGLTQYAKEDQAGITDAINKIPPELQSVLQIKLTA